MGQPERRRQKPPERPPVEEVEPISGSAIFYAERPLFEGGHSEDDPLFAVDEYRVTSPRDDFYPDTGVPLLDAADGPSEVISPEPISPTFGYTKEKLRRTR